MSLVRILVAWLVMAVLPMQGFAAASMVFCDQPANSAAAMHEEHAGHDHHHATGHSPSEAGSASSNADVGHAPSAQLLSSDDGRGDDAHHSCGICASCCHVMAIGDGIHPPVAADPPSISIAHASAPVLTRTSPRPDKPPRA